MAQQSIRQQVAARLQEEMDNQPGGFSGAVLTTELYQQLVEMAMSNPLYHVEEFHRVYGHPINSQPLPPANNTDMQHASSQQLRYDLIEEEFDEFHNAYLDNDHQAMFDACCDLVYVCIGAMLALGWPARLGMEEVHASNMSKLDENGQPIVREDGKILKGPNYFAPRWDKVFQQHAKENGRV